jgi:hypothetical protein
MSVSFQLRADSLAAPEPGFHHRGHPTTLSATTGRQGNTEETGRRVFNRPASEHGFHHGGTETTEERLKIRGRAEVFAIKPRKTFTKTRRKAKEGKQLKAQN